MNNLLIRLGGTFVALLATSAAFASSSIFNDFESMSTGAVPGGADPRAPGNGMWHNPDNSATYGIVTDGIGLGGSRGLVIGNRGNGFDGVIDNVKSARLSDSAGESTVAPNYRFTSSFFFRTAATTGYAYDGTQATDYEFKTETWGIDRTTWFGVFNDENGNLYGYGSGIDANGDWIDTSEVSLSWGEWYRLETTIDFVDGGPANDMVTYTLYDLLGNSIFSASSFTWEEGARQYGYAGGDIFSVDAVGLQARYSRADALGETYIDNLYYSAEAVPEPMTIAGIAGAVAFVVRKRKRN